MFHILLQIDVDAGCQKFMLRSLAWVLFTIPKLGCKGSGLCSGQNLVFLVGAGKLRCPACTGFLGLLGRTPSHTHPLCTPRTRPFVHQRFLGCIGRSNSTLREFVCGHGTCLLTNRDRKQHRHRPKWTKISNISSVQHANLGVPNSPFSGFPNIPHNPPPLGHSAGTNEATTAPTPANALCWHEITRPREICSCILMCMVACRAPFCSLQQYAGLPVTHQRYTNNEFAPPRVLGPLQKVNGVFKDEQRHCG